MTGIHHHDVFWLRRHILRLHVVLVIAAIAYARHATGRLRRDLHESNTPELGIELSKRDRRYLNLIAHHPTAGPLPDVDTLMWQLHQANRRILLGSCIFDPERSLLYHRSTLPLAWAPIDAARVGWLIDHAAAALDLLAPGMGD